MSENGPSKFDILGLSQVGFSRCLLIPLAGWPFNINITQIDAFKDDKPAQKLEQDKDLDFSIQLSKKNDINTMMGDLTFI